MAVFTVGITGGIGSGKSAVTEQFAGLDVPVIDLDTIARQIVAPGLPAHREVVEAFGHEFVKPGGQLDRARLRRAVFADPARRTVLEDILHPRIFREMRLRLIRLNAHYCIAVIPLLAESSRKYPLDRVLVVDAPRAVQVSRVVERDSQTAQDVERIIDAQADRGARLAIADDVIDNSGTLEELAEKVEILHRRYLEFAREKQSNPSH